ncbi:hypothetical protein JNB62_14275 [Microbacterium jejuense]|uniref:Uncharacterized protein n=1 Tax=Microbacterium jejuense TaxID=1263637 RepID=A0ABS7HR40_9MICO|nr:hypothetical protein [Microbacterium jejuense]MBW9094855.1 hypothetical protein [Microbacterium jejuense]
MPHDVDGREWAEAVVDGRWLRPAPVDGPREPRWGHPDGLQLGLPPIGGPRGLLRLYTPYLGQPRDRLLNFIAVEPIPAGSTERGYSELERSRLDDVPGLRLWSSDDPDGGGLRDPREPSRGVVAVVDGVETLSVDIVVEPFENGADVWVRAMFRADRPHEISVAAYRRESSVELKACVLSATMGNWARLRTLRLADGEVRAADLWPEYTGVHFAEHARFGIDRLRRDETGAVSVSAVPDEAEPHLAAHAPGTAAHWSYVGVPAVQTWRVEDPDPALVAQVNGRYTYWMSQAPIPGGIAFENFELVEPFRQGRAFAFSAEPLSHES